jgi:glucan phosphoethanolaminetransferase (alkaline phosphatase superfamily)
VFFGLWCILTGYLISKATFMPRILSVLLILNGIGWTLYMWPPLAIPLLPVIAVVAAIAEFPMQLWLIVFGVNSERWTAQAAAADTPSAAPSRLQSTPIS